MLHDLAFANKCKLIFKVTDGGHLGFEGQNMKISYVKRTFAFRGHGTAPDDPTIWHVIFHNGEVL